MWFAVRLWFAVWLWFAVLCWFAVRWVQAVLDGAGVPHAPRLPLVHHVPLWPLAWWRRPTLSLN